MRMLMRLFGLLLLTGGIAAAAFFSYFAFVEGGRFAERDKRVLAGQEEKVNALKRELEKSGNSKGADPKIEKEYETAIKNYQSQILFAADNEQFYKRQTLYAAAGGAAAVAGLLIFILSFTGRKKHEKAALS